MYTTQSNINIKAYHVSHIILNKQKTIDGRFQLMLSYGTKSQTKSLFGDGQFSISIFPYIRSLSKTNDRIFQ